MSKPEAPGRPESLRSLLGVVVVFFLLLLAIASVNSSRDLTAARQRERLLEIRIEETQERIDLLRGRIERLRSDPGTLERLAREELGLVRPGDVVIVLPEEGGGAAPAPPVAVPQATGPSPQGDAEAPRPAVRSPS